MTTLAIFGDRHFSREFARADHVLEMWDWAIADALAHGATHFVGLGDVCEGDPDGDERWALGQRYQRMLAAGPVVEITGNHESYAAHRWLELLGVQVVWNAIAVIRLDGIALVCCPYPRLGWPPFDAPIEDARQRALWTIQDAILPAPEPFLFLAHATPEGSETRNTRFERHHQAEIVLPARLCERAMFAIFGHIHRPQTLWRNGLVVGSMVRVDFDEAEDAKRYLLVNVDDTGVQITSRPLPVRQMIQATVRWMPGLTLNDVFWALPPVAGADVKITVQVPVDALVTYTPEIFDPVIAEAATCVIHKTIETPVRARRPALPEEATFADEVRECLEGVELRVDQRMRMLAGKIEELEAIR